MEISKLATLISRQSNIVPIIGNDLLWLQIDGKRIHLYDKIATDLLQTLKETYDNDASIQALSLSEKWEYPEFNLSRVCLEWMKVDRYARDLIFEHVKTLMEQYESENLLALKSFEYIVKIKPFRYFINASFTNCIENAIKQFRAMPSDNYDRATYVHKSRSPKPDDIPNLWDAKETPLRPVIYNLCGSYEHDNEFMLTEDDILEQTLDMQKWLSGTDELNNLRQLLKENSLLFIGCNYRDWLFRFFARTLFYEGFDFKGGAKFGLAADSSLADDNGRVYFLSRHNWTVVLQNAETFVEELYNELLARYPKTIMNEPTAETVFISYASENKAEAIRIYEALWAENIPAWLDLNEIDFGENITEAMRDAIDKCRIFMPLISAKTAPPDNRRHYYKEWEYAGNTQKSIVPVTLNLSDNALGTENLPAAIRSARKIQLQENWSQKSLEELIKTLQK